ncbi:hypothetical protein D9757_014540, partial [Collybiopsis confluens]
HEIQASDASSCNVHGTKLVVAEQSQSTSGNLTVHLFDFNQRAVRKAISDGAKIAVGAVSDMVQVECDTSLCVTAPSVFRAGDLFKDEVKTWVPYRWVARTIVPDGEDISAVKCSEDSLLVSDDFWRLKREHFSQNLSDTSCVIAEKRWSKFASKEALSTQESLCDLSPPDENYKTLSPSDKNVSDDWAIQVSMKNRSSRTNHFGCTSSSDFSSDFSKHYTLFYIGSSCSHGTQGSSAIERANISEEATAPRRTENNIGYNSKTCVVGDV